MSNKHFNEYINSGIKRQFKMNSSKKKTDLIEMIVYGCITGGLKMG